MRKIVFVVLTVLCGLLLSPLPAQALATSPTPPTKAVDGSNKKKPRKRSSKKVNKTASVKAAPRKPIVPVAPSVQIYGSVEGEQLIINIYHMSLFSQNMQQSGDKIQLYGVQSGPLPASTDAADRQLAERFVKELKTKQAFFMRTPPTKKSAEMNCIALNKERWTEADVAAIQRIVTESFAPQQVAFFPVAITTQKPLLLPGTVSKNPE